MTAIAIVGMGCRFAHAPDLQSYWKLTLEGRDAFTSPPPDRWDESVFHDTSRRATDKSYAPTGAFIKDIRSFPAMAFGLPPRRVEVMDPQQRFALEVCRQAIEDSGYHPSDMPYRTGVFIGVTATEYRTLMASRMLAQMMAAGNLGSPPPQMSAIVEAVENVVPSRPFSAPGALANMTAATVAQELDLHGPAYTTDAACASAMVALHDAVAHLRAGTIDAALAGGAYICITPEHHIAFSRIGAMSAQGKCLPFDARADGFVQGDGAGIVLLKRMDDAIRDGDRIYAAVNGVAMNNDGRGDGPMAPVSEGQAEAVRAAWRDAGIDRSKVGYVEAHGTGTTVGDGVEFSGLQRAFGDEVVEAWLGSSKANVGHTMSAAAIAGIIRAALAIYHRQIPPMANFESAREELQIQNTNWKVPTQPVPWSSNDRVAGVSSFGFGGTNGHAVLSGVEYTEDQTEQAELLLISAPDEASVRALAGAIGQAVQDDASLTPSGVAAALSVRADQPSRLAVVVSSRQDLIETLSAVANGERPKGSHLGVADDEAPKVAFMYPGQGSQRTGMLAAVRDRFPVVAQTLAALEGELSADLPVPLTHLIYPQLRAEPVDEQTATDQLTDTANCQPALLACGIALTALLNKVGVQPVAVVGHSLGEFTAAAAGGVLTAAEAARFVAARGRSMAALEGDHGAMAAIMADRPTAEGFLVDGAVIANVNHPRQLVVSGSTDAIAKVVGNAKAAGVKAIPLAVSHGFHSPVLAGLDSKVLIENIDFQPPTMTVASAIANRPYADADDARAVFERHAISPVLFTDALAQCRDAGADLFLQVGAGGPLAAFARGSLERDHKGILSLASTDDADGGRSLLETLGRLWIAGVPVDVRAVVQPGLTASIPPAVYERQAYWAVKAEAQLPLNMKGYTPRERKAPEPVVSTQPAEVAAAKPDVDEVTEKVIAVVAKVSAYPRNALKTSMTLIDDLGFDSLMVNDLASGLADAFPGMGGIPQELFINRPTVHDLIDFARTSGTAGPTAIRDDEPLQSYAPVWLEAERASGRASADGKRALVVNADDVAASLEAMGVAVTRLSAEAAAKAEPADVIVWSGPKDLPSVSSVLAGEVAWPDLAGNLIAALDRQALLKSTPDLIVVRSESDPWSAALGGVARAVAREWPDATSKHIVLADTDASAVVDEWLSSDRTIDVRLGTKRQVLGFETQEIATAAPNADDTVLITGGTRGIGAKLGERLFDAGATVLLMGRGDPSESAASLIARSEGRVEHLRADVTDRAAVASTIAGRAVTALIHSAGVLADGELGKTSAEASATARRVKVEGWLNAIAACGATLRTAIGIGSWAGRFGNRHQSHYAAANALLAELASHTPTLRAVVPEFGPWIDSDMVRTIPAPIMATMRTEGVAFVADEPGLDAITNLLSSGTGALVQGRDLPHTTRHVQLTDRISTDTHPYLLDHAIEGTPVLPLVAAADMLAHAAGVPAPFEMLDLRLFAPVTVTEPVDITLIANGEKVELRIGERKTLAYRARIRPLTSGVSAPEPADTGKTCALTVKEFYDDITFHGPSLQGIRAFEDEGDTFIRGRIHGGQPVDWIPATQRQRWVIDPLAMDSAFQLSGAVAWTRLGRAGTPLSIKRFALLAPWPTSDMQAEVSFEALDDSSDRFVGTIAIRDADGVLIAIAEETAAEMRKVDSGDDDAEPFVIKPEWTDVSQWAEAREIAMRLEGAKLMGVRNPYFTVHDGTAKNVTSVEGKELVNYSSYNYLGLSGDPRVSTAVKNAVDIYGTSVSASRVASGERAFHGELEKLLAKCQGTQDALVFTAGHATNVTTIGHVMNPEDLILHDELIHDSALQGIKLAGASRRAFKHDDPADLERQLKDLRPHYQKCLIIVEGAYSMDGDVCDLPSYIAIKKKYGCLLMVDEAHSFGIVGSTGQGLREHFDIDGMEVDLWMGTLSKSLASCGGWIAASTPMIQFLKYTAPGFVYSAGITPANGVAGLMSLKLMLEEPWRVQKLQSNSLFFHDALHEHGLDTGPARGESAVVPVVTGNSMHALMLSQRLVDQGINVQPIVYPAVSDDAARLRFFLSSTHTEEQLSWTAQRVAETLAEVQTEFPAL